MAGSSTSQLDYWLEKDEIKNHGNVTIAAPWLVNLATKDRNILLNEIDVKYAYMDHMGPASDTPVWIIG